MRLQSRRKGYVSFDIYFARKKKKEIHLCPENIYSLHFRVTRATDFRRWFHTVEKEHRGGRKGSRVSLITISVIRRVLYRNIEIIYIYPIINVTRCLSPFIERWFIYFYLKREKKKGISYLFRIYFSLGSILNLFESTWSWLIRKMYPILMKFLKMLAFEWIFDLYLFLSFASKGWKQPSTSGEFEEASSSNILSVSINCLLLLFFFFLGKI